jgi:hypothetical protein
MQTARVLVQRHGLLTFIRSQPDGYMTNFTSVTDKHQNYVNLDTPKIFSNIPLTQKKSMNLYSFNCSLSWTRCQQLECLDVTEKRAVHGIQVGGCDLIYGTVPYLEVLSKIKKPFQPQVSVFRHIFGMGTFRVQTTGPVYSIKTEATRKWRQRNR